MMIIWLPFTSLSCQNILFRLDSTWLTVRLFAIYSYSTVSAHNFCVYVTDLATSLSIRPASSSGANNSDVNLDNGPVVLVCLATGHPEPSYVWLDLSTDSTVSVQIYLISSPGEYRLQCTASTDVTFANGSVIPHSVSARYYINGM